MIRERIKRMPELVRHEIVRTHAIWRAARHTHLAQSFSARGVLAVAKALADGGSNPALIYRIYAADRPDAPAIVHEARVIRYGELYESITRCASALARRGVHRGSSVLIVLGNRPEFIVAQNAAALLGAAAVSASSHATRAELEHLANHSRAGVAIVEAELAERVRDVVRSGVRVVVVGGDSKDDESWERLVAEPAEHAKLKPSDDAAVVVYTSGTTGKPKGAVRKFPRDTIESTLRFIEATPMREADVHLVAAPLYHSTAYAFATMAHLLGGSIVLESGHFDPARFLAALEKHRVNTTAVVPTMLHRVVEHLDATGARAPHLPRLRAMFSGGAPLSAALASRVLDHFGDVLFNFYGATETGLVTLATPSDLRAAPGTIGRAVPGVEIRLLREDGSPAAVDEPGELYAKSPLLAAGYLRDESATNEATRAGFFSVGDIAKRDASGRYFLEGRKRELVISGGVNVYPVEVEHTLEAHPAIAEAAVVGVPDEDWGERVVAFLRLREGATVDAEAVRAWTKERLASAKVPREFVFVAELPRNPTGKIVKAKLVATHLEPKAHA